MDFKLPEGTDIPDISGLENGYETSGDGKSVTALLSAEKLAPFISDVTEAMEEPIFFFIELPCSEDEERELRRSPSDNFHYRLYYLDNCTKPVIRAILKTYGDLLISDGLCRFGFGGNESGDEIYVQTYKVTSVFCGGVLRADTVGGLLEKRGAKRTEKLLTPWDILSPSNPGTCARVENDGMTVFDLPELLADAGMYFAEII